MLAAHDKPFLLRELILPQDEARAKKRQALDAERFALAKTALRRSSPYRPSFVDYIEGRFAVFTHRNLDRLTSSAAEAPAADEEELHRLVAPVIAVLQELHRADLICCSIRPEEILIDPEDATVPIFAGLQHVYHLRGMGPPRPGPDEAGVFAPEFAQRQQPLTVAADVYALAALLFSLLRAGPPSCFDDEGSIEAALRSVDPARCSSRLSEALILGLSRDPAQRPPSVGELKEMAFEAPAKKLRAGNALVRKGIAMLPPIRLIKPESETPEPIEPAAETNPEAAAEAVPAWPPIRAYLDAQTAGKALPTPEPDHAPPEPEPESEIATAAKGLAAAFSQCAMAPIGLARSAAGDAAAFARKAPHAIATASARAHAALSELRTPAIAAALVGVAVVGLGHVGFLKPSPRIAAAISASVSHERAERSVMASADDLVRLPPDKDQMAAVQDELISREAARSLSPQVLTVDAKPVMVTLPTPQSADSAASDAAQAPSPEPENDPAIASVQTELRRLGLYSGAIDGVVGRQTLAGIRAAERVLHRDLNADSGAQLAAALHAMTPAQGKLARALIAAPKNTQIVEARAIARPLPSFPRDAFSQRIEGWVEVSFDVDPQGGVQHAEVTGFNNGRALEAFSAQALDAIDHAVYEPARKNGKPVWSRGLKVRYQFDVIHHGWGPFKSREPRSSIVADSSPPGTAVSTLQ